jgi:hypothetical protein
MRIIPVLKNYIKNYLIPHNDIVITYIFSEAQNIKCSALINNVNYSNYKDALIYEPLHKVEQFKNFLDSGDHGYYAYLNGKWAHRSWVTFGPRVVHRWFHFTPMYIEKDEAFIHWCETASYARGLNIYPAVLSKIVNDMKGSYKNIYIATTINNTSSQKGILKAGFKEFERIKIFSLMNITTRKVINL